VIKKFLQQSLTINSAAILLGFFAVLSRLIGLIRDRLLAGQFGASIELDIYFAAFRIPDLMYQMLTVGALSASFIPLFTKIYKKKSAEAAFAMTNNVLHHTLLFFAFFSVIAIFLAPQLAALIAPGLIENTNKIVELMRLLFISQLILSISMIYGSVLQSLRKFLIYSLAPIFYNFGIIFGILYLSPRFGIEGVVFGVILGAIFHAIIQWFGAALAGYRYQLKFNPGSNSIRYIVRNTPPRMIGLAIAQFNLIIMTAMASMTGSGSITMLQFAYNLNFFPVGVVGVSYAIAVFPVLCSAEHDKSKANFKDAFSSTVKQICFFLIPITAATILLRAQIVRAVVGAGQFDWLATYNTAYLLGIFALSFIFQSLVYVLVRAYFAKEDTVTPLAVGLLSLGVQVAVSWYYLPIFEVIALAIGFSVASFVQFILLWIILSWRMRGLREGNIISAIMPLLVAGAMSAIGIQWTKYIIDAFIQIDTFLEIALQVAVSVAVGGVLYVFIALMLRSPEMEAFVMSIKSKLLRDVKTSEVISGT
jgi:putative peptidoglycan lipid II flippase